MPKPKTIRHQPRFDPNRGGRPPQPHEMVELVDPGWILKALGLMLALGVTCAILTLVFFRHYQKVHSKPSHAPTTSQPTGAHP